MRRLPPPKCWFPPLARPLQNPVIPADAGASADETSIQNQQRPRHSRARASSFPRTREPRINRARLFSLSRRPLQNPVIPADAGASADETSIQNQQRPRHSRARASSFPRTREPRINRARLFTHPGDYCKTPSFPRTRESRINKARLFTPSRRPLQNPRHSRGRGRFSGRNVHPESTTTPSFPRPSLVIPADAGTQNQQSTPFPPSRRPLQNPRHSRESRPFSGRNLHP